MKPLQTQMTELRRPNKEIFIVLFSLLYASNC